MKCQICSAEFAAGGVARYCPLCLEKMRLSGDTSASFGKGQSETAARPPARPRVAWTADAAGGADLKWPVAVALHPNGDICVLDQPDDYRILRFDGRGRPLGVLLSVASGQLEEPTAFGFAPDATLYVVDSAADRICVWDAEGRFVRTLGGTGTAPGQLARPIDLALDRDGCIYVAEAFNRRVQKLSSEGVPYLEVGDAGQWGRFEEPAAVSLDSAEAWFVADKAANRVFRFSVTGQPRGCWPGAQQPGGLFDEPCSLRIGSDGSVYVADRDFARIHCLSPAGELRGSITLGGGEADYGSFVVRGGDLLVPDRMNDRLLCLAFP